MLVLNVFARCEVLSDNLECLLRNLLFDIALLLDEVDYSELLKLVFVVRVQQLHLINEVHKEELAVLF